MIKCELSVLCKYLEKGCTNKLCDNNEIVCAKRALRQCVGNDKNKYWKIKAQIEQYDKNDGTFFEFMTKYAAICALILGIIYNVYGEASKNYVGYAILILVILLVLCITNVCFLIRNIKVNKWIRYIDFALDDIARDKKWI